VSGDQLTRSGDESTSYLPLTMLFQVNVMLGPGETEIATLIVTVEATTWTIL